MVIMSACILAAHALPFSTFGIFLKPLTEEFKWERGSIIRGFLNSCVIDWTVRYS